MSLLVQKFGGTSVASLDHIENVAGHIVRSRAQGHAVAAVVSAMGKETDRLALLATEVGQAGQGSRREIDMLLATGEQVSAALLAMMLIKFGCPARSYTGGQIRILTDNKHTRARILDIDTAHLTADIKAGTVPVVCGFQGVDSGGNITTLGRGGSDTTAVALAAILNADECQIYTDVDGVYTADPRVVDSARRLTRITFEEMLELASLGARVLHARSVEFASKYQIPMRVLSSFEDSEGTLITSEGDVDMEQPLISGIAFTRDEAKLTILGVQDVPGVAFKILSAISDAAIEVDMIVQNVSADNTTDFTFTVSRGDFEQAHTILGSIADKVGAREVSGDNKIAKLSLVGVGMKSHAGVASKMFGTLSNESINIQLISTSEIKISVVIAEIYLELAVRALHRAFDLDVSK